MRHRDPRKPCLGLKELQFDGGTIFLSGLLAIVSRRGLIVDVPNALLSSCVQKNLKPQCHFTETNVTCCKGFKK